MNANIKKRAKDIMKNDLVTMLIGAGIFTLVNTLASAVNTNSIGSIITGLVTTITSACAACFYYRAFIRGRGDTYDTYALLTDSVNLSKAINIGFIMWIVNTIISMLVTALTLIPLIGAIAAIVIMAVVSYLLRIVWYLFVVNPRYQPVDYLKYSAEYMKGHFIELLVFSISVTLVPALLEGMLTIFVGYQIAGIICLPLEAYVSLAMAGYFAQLIPSNW